MFPLKKKNKNTGAHQNLSLQMWHTCPFSSI